MSTKHIYIDDKDSLTIFVQNSYNEVTVTELHWIKPAWDWCVHILVRSSCLRATQKQSGGISVRTGCLHHPVSFTVFHSTPPLNSSVSLSLLKLSISVRSYSLPLKMLTVCVWECNLIVSLVYFQLFWQLSLARLNGGWWSFLSLYVFSLCVCMFVAVCVWCRVCVWQRESVYVMSCHVMHYKMESSHSEGQVFLIHLWGRQHKSQPSILMTYDSSQRIMWHT